MDELKPLLRILMEAAPRSYDPLSRREAGRLFAALLGRGGKTCFEGSLAMIMQCSKRVGSATGLALLFSWTCELAAKGALPEGGALQGPAFPKLVVLQCQLLARVGQADANKRGKAKVMAGCVAKAHALFRHTPRGTRGAGRASRTASFKDALSKYLEVVAEATDAMEIEGGTRMIASYFGHKSRGADPAFAPVKEALVKIYNKGVLAATQGPKGCKIPASTAEAFEGLMRWITHEEFGPMTAEMTRILRRTPEYLMESMAMALGQLTIDTSRYVEPLIEILTELILQEECQAMSIKLIANLAQTLTSQYDSDK